MATATDSSLSPAEARVANQRAREELAASFRGLDHYGMSEGICNHLTLRAPARNGKGDVMLIIPYGIHWSQVTASCFVGVDIHSKEVVEGTGETQNSGVDIHSALYRAYGDEINCIMHIHPPYTTALACLKDPTLKMVHQTCMRFFGKIGYDLNYGGTGNMGDESTRLAKCLAGKEIMVMGNHGVMAVGKTAANAFDALYYFERAAMFQMIASATGKELAEVTDDVAKGVADYIDACGDDFKIDHFEAIKKLIGKKEPDFRS